MAAGTELERRDRALITFTLVTGARDGAIASMKLKHVDLIEKSVSQDAREVKTKFSKTFTTSFFPVGEEMWVIVADWVTYLRENKLWDTTTRFSRDARLRWAQIGNLRFRGCRGLTGAQPRPFARYFATLLLALVCSILTRTAFEIRLSSLAKGLQVP